MEASTLLATTIRQATSSADMWSMFQDRFTTEEDQEPIEIIKTSETN